MLGDLINFKVRGRFEAELVNKQGEVVEQVALDNLVTDSMSLFLTGMIGSNYATISHFAIGDGVGTGSLQDPQPHDRTSLQLRSETHRLALTGTTYADVGNELGDTLTNGDVTNRLVFIGEVVDDLSPPEITEIALFGGPGASQAGSGMMTNVVTFPFITKPTNLSLRFRWTLTFTTQGV